MKIKTFNAAALAEAIAEIKKELGEEALILSTKEVEVRKDPNQPPTRSFEVVAAGDPEKSGPRSIPPSFTSSDASQQAVSSPSALAARRAYQSAPTTMMTSPEPSRPAPGPDPKSPPPMPPAFSSLATPITNKMAFGRTQESAAKQGNGTASMAIPPNPAPTSMNESGGKTVPSSFNSSLPFPPASEKTHEMISREVVELKRLIRWSAQSVVSSRFQFPNHEADALFVDLVANDMDEATAKKILMDACALYEKEQKAKSLESYARRVFRDSIRVAPIDERGRQRVVSIFLGPTGVGKTTTIAKLASHFSLELKRKTLLITLDTYRIGAAEQLRIYANLIGIPLLVAGSIAELDRHLQAHTEADVILIDTVGRAHSRLHQLKDLAEYVRGKDWIEKHLVLSLTTKPLDLREITHAYQLYFCIDKLLFTKLDETMTSGAAANELIRTQKPLSYMTNGQNVPQDIQIPTPASFAEFILCRDYGDIRMEYA